MPKQSITQSTVTVTNIQSLPDVVVGDATNLKATFDKNGLDEKTYINTVLIPELNGDDGSKKIGHDSANLGSDNVADALEEVRLIAVQAQAGDILPNSITNTELGVDVKVGSLASLTTAEKSSVVGAINEIDSNTSGLPQDISDLQTDLNIVRTAKTTTGSAVALAVDTDGTFDLTRNGNILTIIPNVSNTGAMTINVDGQGAKSVKKFNIDTDSFVDTEAGDSKKNTPLPLTWDLANDFFVLAPKGGGNIKSIQNISATIANGISTSTTVSISSVDLTKTIFEISYTGDTNIPNTITTLVKPQTNSLINIARSATTGNVSAKITVTEYNNVKSLQSAEVSFTAVNTFDVSISSVNLSKSKLFLSFRIANATVDVRFMNCEYYFLDSTTIRIKFNQTITNCVAYYQVIEFN